MRERSGLRERLERWFFFLALAFLLVVTGMLLARYKIFPYPLVDDAIKGAGAAAVQIGLIRNTDTGTDVSDGERASAESGVTRHDPAFAYQGYTLYAAGNSEQALLIDMQGRTIHRWSLSWNAIRDKYAKERKLPELQTSWRSVHLYPNGDLLVTLQGEDVTPYGLATLKLDKDSKLLWANFERAHHDAVVAEDGRIYTIAQEIRRTPVPQLDTIDPPILEDFVLVLSRDGRTLQRLSVMDAFTGTPYASAVRRLVKGSDWKGDYFHVNAIEPYDSHNEIAIIRKNQVLVSIRNMDTLATMDLASGKIVWLLNGSWNRQHDPDIMGGRIMLFDNRGDFSRESRSRVVEFDPLTQEITWQAAMGDGYDLYSGWGASQQPLANGNVLINEAVPARLLELTRDGKLVWEFHAAGRDESGKFAAPILEAKRYAPDDLRFQFNGG
jgi:outer membrane protein assembly factor BamB